MKKSAYIFMALFLSFVLSACGYTTRSTLPIRLKTIHIESFKNNISYTQAGRRNLYLPMLEIDVRNAIIDRFLFNGNLKVTEPDMADLILKGELRNYERHVLRHDDNNDVEEYRIQITVSLALFDVEQESNMWTFPGFVGETTYYVSGINAKTEEAALDAAIEDLSRRIVEQTVEYW
ncbi:MAG: LptE family protein [Candidatus Zapsychrus exili]|nr:LptE family protein [Candidatus Zapsychrus exili]